MFEWSSDLPFHYSYVGILLWWMLPFNSALLNTVVLEFINVRIGSGCESMTWLIQNCEHPVTAANHFSMANMQICNWVYPLRMEILLLLSSKSYCFPLYNVAIPVDDSFAGYGLFLVIDDRMAKACFIFTLRNHYSIALMFAVVLNSNRYPHFSLWKRIVNIHFSNDSLWMKALLESCPFHSWKYTMVLLSFHAIQFLVLVLLCIWRWQSIIVLITIVSLTHLSFPTKGFAFDQQCASPNPTIKWVKVMKSSTWMRKAIHYHC